jgi:hypothetical protein
MPVADSNKSRRSVVLLLVDFKLKRRLPAAHGRQALRMGARGCRPRNPSHGPELEIPRDSPIQVPDFAGKRGRNPRFPVGRRERASGPRGRREGDFGLWAKVRFPQPSRGFSGKLTCSELQVSLPDSGGASWPRQTPKWAPHSHVKFPLIPDLAGKLGGSLRFPIEPIELELEGPIMMIRPGAAMGVPGAAGGGFCPGSASASCGDMRRRGQRNPGPGRGTVVSGRDLACRRVQTTTCST